VITPADDFPWRCQFMLPHSEIFQIIQTIFLLKVFEGYFQLQFIAFNQIALFLLLVIRKNGFQNLLNLISGVDHLLLCSTNGFIQVLKELRVQRKRLF